MSTVDRYAANILIAETRIAGRSAPESVRLVAGAIGLIFHPYATPDRRKHQSNDWQEYWPHARAAIREVGRISKGLPKIEFLKEDPESIIAIQRYWRERALRGPLEPCRDGIQYIRQRPYHLEMG